MTISAGNRAANKRRAPVKRKGRGATRKVAAPRPRRQWSFGWLNRLLVLVGAGAVLAVALQGFITLQAIPVERIAVTGNIKHIQTEAVKQMVQPALVGGFLGADLTEVREQLEVLPWVYRASVRRRWPHSLEIHVVEQLPIARWGDAGFLNHEGAIFHSANAEALQDLPRLVGPEGSARELVATYQRLDDLLGDVALKVQSLSMDRRGQLEAVLSGGIRLVLGNEQFLERMRRFIAVYRSDLAPRAGEIARVDLRYQSGMAVAFHEPAQVAGLNQ